MLIRNLIAYLAAFLAIGVDPPDDDAPDNTPPPGTTPDASGGSDDELPDLDAPDDPDDGAIDPPADHQAMLRQATERAERAEREASDTRRRVEELERSRAAPQQTDEQRLREHEEARLRAPDLTANEKWQIEANRTLRANQQAAQQALWESREASDKTAFRELIGQRPVAKKYEKRVEEKLVEIRKGGHNLERKLVLAMLIGTDIVDGKVKTKPRTASGGDTTPTQRVDRGTPPRQRGDVRARGGSSEQAKRSARLENQII